MKKAITFILSMLLVLSLVACGSQTESVGKIDEEKQQTEQVSQTEQPDSTQQNETDTPEETEQPETSVQEESVVYTLDTVPKPVMEEMGSEIEEDYAEYASRFPSTSHQELFDYLAALEDDGFTITVTNQEEGNNEGGYTYEAEAVHENATVSIYYEWSTPLQGSVVRETGIFDVVISVEEVELPNVNADLSLDEFDSLIPTLPDVKWYDNDFENNNARWKHHQTSQLDMEDIAEYVNSLKDSGYTIDMEEAPNGNEDYDVYYFSAKNQDGVEVEVKVSAPENGVLATTISVGVKK